MQSEPTPVSDPLPAPTITEAPLGHFRNLTHPSINAVWARRKADGEPQLRNLLPRALGLNWIPVYPDSVIPPSNARLEKELVCGELERAALFIGKPPTREFDWNFHIRPDSARFVDTTVLRHNAERVRHFRVDLDRIYPKSGKLWDTDKWHDAAARGPGSARRYLIEAEVSAPMALLGSAESPFVCDTADGACNLQPREMLETPVHARGGIAERRVCVYGPWVQEASHGFRPEIHPAEALIWRDSADGSIHVLMLQDASGRFDGGQGKDWITTAFTDDGPDRAEYWVQEAMVGEYTLVLPRGDRPAEVRVEVVGEQGLEPIGHHGFVRRLPPLQGRSAAGDSLARTAAQAVVAPRSMFASPGSGDAEVLVLRAQIRGALPDEQERRHNRGAYAHFRITGVPTRAP